MKRMRLTFLFWNSFVSKAGAGCGRASGDRQFFYVNGRPVEMPKAGKLLNETYRAFNSLQYPMAVLNFVLPTVSSHTCRAC
jgi:DNA mismatch repair protein PMS2